MTTYKNEATSNLVGIIQAALANGYLELQPQGIASCWIAVLA